VEGRTLAEYTLAACPAEWRPALRRAARDISVRVGGWFRAQLLLAAVIGGITAVALPLLGVPNAVPLALLAAVGEFLPYVGPLLAALPTVALALGVSTDTAIAAAVFYFLLQQVENYLLVPWLMGERLGVPAAVVIIALLVGGAVLGIIGVLVALPTLLVAESLLHAWRAIRDVAPVRSAREARCPADASAQTGTRRPRSGR
jgi:predicted PurR-regulated permease PerM